MIKNDLEEYLRNYTGRFNCRWMCKNNPQLWSRVVAETCFLPDGALPKQRCWHIINEIYAIPLCPVTGQPVRWFENRYLSHSSSTASNNDPAVKQKKLESYQNRTGNAGHWGQSNSTLQKRANTVRQKVKNEGRARCHYTHSDEWYAKIKATWSRKTGIPHESRDAFNQYRRDVTRETERSYRIHFDRVSPTGLLKSRENHIDHIFSVMDGFKLNIPPFIIGHCTNLRVIPRLQNLQKYHKSEKTIDALYCDILDFLDDLPNA